jgi:hypothetical protein
MENFIFNYFKLFWKNAYVIKKYEKKLKINVLQIKKFIIK